MDWLDRAKQFVLEAVEELKKVTWLSRRELIASTSLVIILILAVSVYVGFIDFLLSQVLGRLLR